MPKSELGQTRHFKRGPATSGLPDQRTSSEAGGMSQTCHFRTHAPRQTASFMCSPSSGPGLALDVLVEDTVREIAARGPFRIHLPAPQNSTKPRPPAIPAAGPSGRFHERNRLTLIGWQRRAASGHFRRRQLRTRRCSLGIPGYSDRAARRRSQTVRPSSGRRLPPGSTARRGT